MALSGCAAGGMTAMTVAGAAGEAALARAVLPSQTLSAELLQPWTGP